MTDKTYTDPETGDSLTREAMRESIHNIVAELHRDDWSELDHRIDATWLREDLDSLGGFLWQATTCSVCERELAEDAPALVVEVLGYSPEHGYDLAIQAGEHGDETWLDAEEARRTAHNLLVVARDARDLIACYADPRCWACRKATGDDEPYRSTNPEEEARELEAHLTAPPEADLEDGGLPASERAWEAGYRDGYELNAFNQQEGDDDLSFWRLSATDPTAVLSAEDLGNDWRVRVVSAEYVAEVLTEQLIEGASRSGSYGDTEDDAERSGLADALARGLRRWWEGDPRRSIREAVLTECIAGTVGEDADVGELLDLIARLRRQAEGVAA